MRVSAAADRARTRTRTPATRPDEGAARAHRPSAGPRRPADGPCARRAPRRGAPPGRRPSRSRRAARAAPREDAAVTALERVPAVGGTRTVPAPDPIARDYILLGLRLDQHIPGLVDGYFGPADLKATVDMAQLRAPARLRADAAALRDRLPAEVTEPDRRAWLDLQLVALETQAAALAGDPLPYLEHVTRCFAYAPPRIPDARFEAAAATIDGLLPGDAPLADRLSAWDARFVIDVERLPAVVEWLVGRFRATAAGAFGLPDGEDLRVSLVTGQPWSAYNWFDGGRRSRIDVNTDLPVRATDLDRAGRPRGVPGPPSRARLEGGRARGSGRSPRVVDPPDQHARVPHQRGTGRPGRPLRRSARRTGRPPGRDPRARRPAHRHRSGRGARGGDPRGGARRAPPRAQLDPGQRGAPAPRRRALPRRGPRGT